ncbi:MAG: DNA-binding response regulator [Calditrichaeota bacterium]|nr:MAG: DNA-binding response regulator [Calditrichota bacterium]MBL1207803.1 DNA-binding response regulator [Calditrichota bacterium]NOG47637.1 response regulator transcription factor [Calditrichota bacterium]
MQKLLIIEDDLAILKALEASFEEEHYKIISATDGIDGLEKALDPEVDIIILDLMLPGKNGKDICREVRQREITTPILVLTSKQDEIDKVLLLELGADDYVTKPPSIRELHARVKALLRRSSGLIQKLNSFTFGNMTLDFKRLEAFKNSEPVKLSSKEFEVIRFLIEHEGEVVSRDQLLNEVWGYDVFPTTRTVDNLILNLRKKIEDDPSEPSHLLTMHGSGYKFLK